MSTYRVKRKPCRHVWQTFRSLLNGPYRKCARCGRVEKVRL